MLKIEKVTPPPAPPPETTYTISGLTKDDLYILYFR
jgi:hypothetical protein